MKRLLLLFALKCYALMLPSLNNPAVWNTADNFDVENKKLISFRYSEPFDSFYNGKIDFAWSDGRFLTAAGFGSAVLDSIYKDFELSGYIGFKFSDFLSLKAGETANISLIPENSSWQEHTILTGADFFYKSWAKASVAQKTYLISKTPINFSWLLSCMVNFNPFYSFGADLPIKEQNSANFLLYQQIKLGYLDIYNSFAYPGPALGFGFILSVSHFSAGASHLRSGYPNGHTGFVVEWR